MFVRHFLFLLVLNAGNFREWSNPSLSIIIPATPSNPSIPYVKRTSKVRIVYELGSMGNTFSISVAISGTESEVPTIYKASKFVYPFGPVADHNFTNAPTMIRCTMQDALQMQQGEWSPPVQHGSRNHQATPFEKREKKSNHWVWLDLEFNRNLTMKIRFELFTKKFDSQVSR